MFNLEKRGLFMDAVFIGSILSVVGAVVVFVVVAVRVMKLINTTHSED